MQATTVQSPATPPAIPQAPAANAPAPPTSVVVTNPDGTTQFLPIPLTRQAVKAIEDRREELSDQLISASSRRQRLAKELMAQPEGAAKAGIEGRLVILDRRLAQLESDIAATGRQLTEAPVGLVPTTESPMGNDIPDNVLALSMVFTLFVLFPVAFALARNLWKRGSRPQVVASSSSSPETNERLERLEQGVDAIALEIERVSEGQRFVTRLLSEAASVPVPQIGSTEKVTERV